MRSLVQPLRPWSKGRSAFSTAPPIGFNGCLRGRVMKPADFLLPTVILVKGVNDRIVVAAPPGTRTVGGSTIRKNRERHGRLRRVTCPPSLLHSLL